jgi:hypothetical protein
MGVRGVPVNVTNGELDNEMTCYQITIAAES